MNDLYYGSLDGSTIVFQAEPTRLVIVDSDGSEIIRFTPDRKVIVQGDIYEAAAAFWEAVKTVLPSDWTLEVA